MISGAPGAVTPRQRQILDWIGAFALVHDRPPSYREIANGLAMKSHSTAQHHLLALRELGWVRWIHGRHCSLEFHHPDGTWHPTPPPATES